MRVVAAVSGGSDSVAQALLLRELASRGELVLAAIAHLNHHVRGAADADADAAFCRELERRMPGEVTTKWWKEERGERVFVDYNQNARDRTIASAYSVRPLPHAPVSAPLAWDELPDVDPRELTVKTMPARFAERGDLHAEIDDIAHDLTTLLEWYERDERDHGLGDMPYPPDYPKMPGEPMRVQPSRAKKPPSEDAAE